MGSAALRRRVLPVQGAVYAENMKVSGGNVTITKSEALQDGGAVYAENMIVSGGGVSINEAEARYDGGNEYALAD
ncbi:hypothetical protein AK812_SmicGene5903 [Symbiodinium microadriaticum]|uniref:Uncharacterized protein n=1 Tax=Symbiodinium microadriaticum TaxID=2951 RepID=A0A1Q9ESI3_SYMMI|nr:hypothetical protein AK812_SmicGene5903 [Symbiodinium microadriaticum]